jgi:hypothetical protein
VLDIVHACDPQAGDASELTKRKRCRRRAARNAKFSESMVNSQHGEARDKTGLRNETRNEKRSE